MKISKLGKQSSLLIATVFSLVVVVASTLFITETRAAWLDRTHYSASATSGNWAVTPGYINPITEGNTSTKIVKTEWTITSAAVSCAKVTITGTSPIAAAWQVNVDRALAPYNGVGSGNMQYQSAPGEPWVSMTGTHTGTLTTIVPSGGHTLTDSTTLLMQICAQNQGTPQSFPESSGFFTTTQHNGTGAEWTTSKACVYLTIQGNRSATDYPFHYGWETSLDLTAAKALVPNSAVTWTPNPSGGFGFETDPSPWTYPAPDSFLLSERQNTALLGNSGPESRMEIKACLGS